MRPGLGWVALGAAITLGAWRMDRLESLNIEPWSAPGLLPGVLGLLIVLFGLAMRVSPAVAASSDPPESVPWGRLSAVLALTALFVFGALGRLPFIPAAAALIFVWMLMLGVASSPADQPRLTRLLRPALIAVIAALVIGTLFQDVLLVRLP